ncbi:Spo0B domain-containing protein [Alkalihalobacillus hwajinpoensis]|uniref:Spo0B C-terminal domain-containing protein n=1 Tax=Guptibacillus hwajinpoensis TaxID=208199 RepID=UPI001883FE49|nr:Spo0B C-terminal domain-containing protein [Pseudalkalibacillus hwajinpoensis]MBF0706385.1 Spo0B domain-containing protein [Pseudalkalibacillus hwajinpoensis]
MQLIKGNLALDHVDRAKEIIEEIIIQSRQEAKLSNLNAPKLAEYILTFNWCNHLFQLDFEVIGDEYDICVYEADLIELISRCTTVLDSYVKVPSDHHLLLTLQLYHEEIHLVFDFQGEVSDQNKLKLAFENPEVKSAKLIELEQTGQELVSTFLIK